MGSEANIAYQHDSHLMENSTIWQVFWYGSNQIEEPNELDRYDRDTSANDHSKQKKKTQVQSVIWKIRKQNKSSISNLIFVPGFAAGKKKS